jgi:hypothetical protein
MRDILHLPAIYKIIVKLWRFSFSFNDSLLIVIYEKKCNPQPWLTIFVQTLWNVINDSSVEPFVLKDNLYYGM